MFTKKLLISHQPGPPDTIGMYAIATCDPGMNTEQVGEAILGGLITFIAKMKSDMKKVQDPAIRARMRWNFDKFAMLSHELIDEVAKIDDKGV